jgi:hypothetical protein
MAPFREMFRAPPLVRRSGSSPPVSACQRRDGHCAPYVRSDCRLPASLKYTARAPAAALQPRRERKGDSRRGQRTRSGRMSGIALRGIGCKCKPEQRAVSEAPRSWAATCGRTGVARTRGRRRPISAGRHATGGRSEAWRAGAKGGWLSTGEVRFLCFLADCAPGSRAGVFRAVAARRLELDRPRRRPGFRKQAGDG